MVARRDADKERLLEQLGRYGIKMYVLYASDRQPMLLSQGLTPDLLRNGLAEHEDPTT